jgi:hypothetical protein
MLAYDLADEAAARLQLPRLTEPHEFHGDPVMKSLRIALAASLLMTGAAASAQSASDARCILLSGVYAKQNQDANAQKLAEATYFFYLGRISAQESAAQLKALFDAQAKAITDATAGGLMNTCAKDFQAKVELVNSLAGPPPAATPPKK